MYFAHELFVKRGPLSKMWLAGTFFRKITKQMIITSSVVEMCDDIRNPPVALALPSLSTLVLGVCRINDRKSFYLQQDAQEYRAQLRSITTKSNVNLPVDREAARYETITLPYPNADFLLELPQEEREIDMDYLDESQREISFTARSEDITLFDREIEPIAVIEELAPYKTEDQMVDIEKFSRDLEAESRISGIEPSSVLPTEYEELTALLEEEKAPSRPPSRDISEMIEEEKEKFFKEKEYRKYESEEIKPVLARKKRSRDIQEDIEIQLTDQQIKDSLKYTRDTLTKRPVKIPKLQVPANIKTWLNAPNHIFGTNKLSDNLISLFNQATILPEHLPVDDIVMNIEEERELEQMVERAEPSVSYSDIEFARGVPDEGVSVMSEPSIEIARGGVEDGYSMVSEPSRDKTFLGSLMEEEEIGVVTGKKRRRISQIIKETEFGKFISYIEVPEKDITPSFIEKRPDISSITEIFQGVLENKFLENEEKALRTRKHVEPAKFLKMLEDQVGEKPTRRDIALSFFSLLVLKSLDYINVQQDIPYREILITRK